MSIMKDSLLKKVIRRLCTKHFFDFLSDRAYIKLFYFAHMGKKLNIDSPQTFNEKLQWLKLHDRKPIYTTMVDKYAAKKYVAGIIGDEYIIPTFGVWDRFDDIDFDSLPEKFVLKCTHDSGGLVICRDKSKLDLVGAKKKIQKSLKRNYYLTGREWPYKDVKPRILAEKYIENLNGLIDYKFYCFDGKPEFLYISQGLEDHSTARISFLTLDWQFATFQRGDYRPFEELPKKPVCFEKMIEIAKMLSNGHAFLRVDLYEIDGHVFFSELTFSPCSGCMEFKPEEWDRKTGELLHLPEKE